MKNCFLILGIAALFAALPAYAELTTADTVSEDYLKNHGYSPVFIQATHKSIAEANGEEAPTYYEHKIYKKGIVRGVRRFLCTWILLMTINLSRTITKFTLLQTSEICNTKKSIQKKSTIRIYDLSIFCLIIINNLAQSFL